MDYRICEANSTDALQREVNQAIGEGWRPAGGVAVAVVAPVGLLGMLSLFYQAMIREVPRLQAQGPGPAPGRPVPAPVRPGPPGLSRSARPRPSEEG